MLSFYDLFAVNAFEAYGWSVGLGIHKRKRLDKSIMLFLKFFVFLQLYLVFKGNILSLAVCLKQGICKG